MIADKVTEGEFAGWLTWRSEAFETGAGPFYFARTIEVLSPRFALGLNT